MLNTAKTPPHISQARPGTAFDKKEYRMTEINKTATRVDHKYPDMRGDARLYRLSPPLEGHQYVVVSAAAVPYSGPETYIFPADADGEITGWLELEGSFRGGLDHEAALENAGYEVAA